MNNMDYKTIIDPELKKLATNPPYNRMMIFLANAYLGIAVKSVPLDEDIKHSAKKINGYNNKKIKIDMFEPKNTEGRLPCLLYFHGGAFSYKASVYHKKLAMIYAKEAHCKVVFPDYHLIPKYPYPASYCDALASYKFIFDNADELNIDKTKIGVAGDSAGGTLAAMVCNSCEKEKLPFPVLQMLVYPLTGVNLETESMKKYTDTPVWRSSYNPVMWKYFFKNREYDYTNSPMHVSISKQTPPTHIETAEYDCLHDDGILYAEKLKAAGINVALYETKGTIHGFDSVLDAKVSQECIQKRIAFLMENF